MTVRDIKKTGRRGTKAQRMLCHSRAPIEELIERQKQLLDDIDERLGLAEGLELEPSPLSPEVFDELVIDDWCHLEQMSKRTWWLGLDGCRVNLEITVRKDGAVTVWHREAGRML